MLRAVPDRRLCALQLQRFDFVRQLQRVTEAMTTASCVWLDSTLDLSSVEGPTELS